MLGSHIATLSTYDREHPKGIEDYPLADLWQNAVGDVSAKTLAAITRLWFSGYELKYFKKWFTKLFSGYPIDGYENAAVKKIVNAYNEKDWWINRVDPIINAIIESSHINLFDFAMPAYVNLINKIPADKLAEVCYEEDDDDDSYYYHKENEQPLQISYLNEWRELAYNHIKDDTQFSAYFHEMWYEYLASGSEVYYGLNYGYNTEAIFRAHSLGFIGDGAVYRYLLLYPQNGRHPFHTLTNKRFSKPIMEKYPAAKGLLDKALDVVLAVECNRSELPTPLTHIISSISRLTCSAYYFAHMLKALADDGFSRQSAYEWRAASSTKKDSVSHLLRRCYPPENVTAKELRMALKKENIPEKRLTQAAIFAPQWAGLLEEALSIPGLKCAVWFFHAHINEGFSAEKETEVAIYSAITPQQFNDGAFDKDWFFESYHALGEKRFIELYKNAKLITASNIAHRRSQLYTEAVLGRMDKEETLTEIKEKRNQERLRAYALIPLDSANKKDALERYEYINLFKKESRQFGSQRQASEGKAVNVALDNLAITTGYEDADRMTWALEGQRADEALTAKEVKALKSRIRAKLEMAMVARSMFFPEEVTGLLSNVILSEMIIDLVFISGDVAGFPVMSDGKLALKGIDEKLHTVTDRLIIAHPYDFMRLKCWPDFQTYIFKNQIKQPFKQVFREYYPITEDELLAKNISTRYEGYQVSPKRTVALLKTRGWTADYEDGLQRVWHKENIVVRMYAMADWFSPSDIEAPTLSTIMFYHRGKWELADFAEIPPVIFSETMRDIDLAVSVAHVGSVDPEASHSTVEMRTAIAAELLSLLSVTNVTFQKAHAIVTGTLGEYSIHMGSGIVHKMGAGMIAVLPVHSQHRGRIFLPFADDDPKTAEIMSKLLLFAQDSKIKDPGILGQIKGR